MALKLLHEKKTTDSCGDYLNNSSYAQFEGNGTIFILKKAFYLSVKLSSTKVLIGDTNFCLSNWRRDRHFTWSSEPRKGLAACSAREYLHCSVILRP